MRIDEENPHGPTSREEIARFEARRKVRLPVEYKEFLLKSNGGMPTPDIFDIPGFHGQGSDVLAFYGIHDGPEHRRFERALEVYDERIPADLIPIAIDSFGNQICIGWKGKRRGKIYFWDHEDELDENGLFVQDYRNVYLVANSLQEFLDNLMTHEEMAMREQANKK